MVSKAQVRYRSTLKSNLVHLPLSLYAPAVQQQWRPQSLVIHIRHAKSSASTRALAPTPEAQLGWTGLASASSLQQYGLASGARTEALETVEMDPGLCSVLGWAENDVVEMSINRTPVKAQSLSVTPLSSDDWEVLESHANWLETNLLSQLRAGTSGQVVPVWVLGKHQIRINIDETNPPTAAGKEAVLLTTNTEIFVAPRPRKFVDPTKADSTGARLQSPAEATTVVTSSLKQATTKIVAQETLVRIGHRTTEVKSAEAKAKELIAYRIIPDRVWTQWGGIANAVKTAGTTDDTGEPNSMPIACVSLRKAKDLRRGQEGEETWIRYSPETPKSAEDAAPEAGPSTAGKPSVKVRLDPSRRLIGVRGIPDGHVVLWPPFAHSAAEGDVHSEWQRSKFEVVRPPKKRSQRLNQLAKPPSGDNREPRRGNTLAGIEDILKETVAYFSRSTALREPGNTRLPLVLLAGTPGSGKTSVAREIASRMESNLDLLSAVVYVDCKAETSGGGLMATRNIIKDWFRVARTKAPCALILDNLDAVIHGEAEHVDNSQARIIAECFASCVLGTETGATHPAGCYIIATAGSEKDLHPILGVRRVFGRTIELAMPDQDVRKQILQTCLQNKLAKLKLRSPADQLDFTRLANLTEGYAASDLQDLVDSAIRVWLQRESSTSDGEHIRIDDFEAAVAESRPRSLRDIKLQTSQVEWADIGGLRDTKAIIRETLEWPTKYAQIFRNCPLRLRSGLLLYGYSGCGKTLLASAVAKECGLHFITVKGPELLNKYIGASEKSVRDIFARAKAARPCVLFFDEFESIAPRRGHDSTGVTDRVVNQLLTEIDGAEGLEGVYVLAATSRPDLIDPALLRPGRLDKSLLCGMPDEGERVEILQAIGRKVITDDSVDWEDVAHRTEGYNGADLQALLSNAQLACVHEAIEAEKTEGGIDGASRSSANASSPFVRDIKIVRSDGRMTAPNNLGDRVALSKEADVILRAYEGRGEEEAPIRDGQRERPRLIIRREHILEALDTSKPSLPSEEKRKLDGIYARFVSGRAAVPSQPAQVGVGKRVSLM